MVGNFKGTIQAEISPGAAIAHWSTLRADSYFGNFKGTMQAVVRTPDSFVFERSRVRVLAGAAGEFSSPGSTFCSESSFGNFKGTMQAVVRAPDS